MSSPCQSSTAPILKPTNLQIYQGDDFAAMVTVLATDGTAADLTGYTPKAQIRRDVADRQPAVAMELTAVLELPNFISLSLTHDQTAMLMGSYVWDLQITDGSGAITTILAGSMSVTQEVTRP
jgi:hypothetical protein